MPEQVASTPKSVAGSTPTLQEGACLGRATSMAAALRSRLSPILSRARSTIEPAYKSAEKTVSTTYTNMMKNNKQYVVEDVETSKLLKQWFFTSMARIPRNMSQSGKEWNELKHKLSQGREMHLTDAGVYALFAFELWAWSCLGEVAGRGWTVTGYYP